LTIDNERRAQNMDKQGKRKQPTAENAEAQRGYS